MDDLNLLQSRCVALQDCYTQRCYEMAQTLGRILSYHFKSAGEDQSQAEAEFVKLGEQVKRMASEIAELQRRLSPSQPKKIADAQ